MLSDQCKKHWIIEENKFAKLVIPSMYQKVTAS